MFKIIFFKMKKQPLLLLIFLITILYGGYYINKMYTNPRYINEIFANSIIYYSCLSPLLISFITSIHSVFEGHRKNQNIVLSSRNRRKHINEILCETIFIWIFNIIILFIIFLFVNVPIIYYFYLFLSLLVFSFIWIPFYEYVSTFYGYHYSLIIGSFSLIFMIYYGTTFMGEKIYPYLPFVYSAKVFSLNFNKLLLFSLIVIIFSFFEIIIVNKKIDKVSYL